MCMKKYGTSYGNKDWKCRSCSSIFQGPATTCPNCKSNSIEPVPDVIANNNTNKQK